MPTSSLGTGQLSLLSGSHTPAKSCESEPPKVGSQTCECGKGTSDCSIHPSTPDKWIASMRDSLAKTLALLESRQAYLREPEAAFTAKSSESLAWFDRDSCSWKTYQQSFLTDSEPYSQTWPRWGMTAGGCAYAHPMSGRRITETGGSSWPTPTASQARSEGSILQMRNLVDAGVVAEAEAEAMIAGSLRPKRMEMWRTPNASDATKWNNQSLVERIAGGSQIRLNNQVAPEGGSGGQLNPNWVGWLMAFPIEWANSKATATPKSRSKQQPPGNSSGAPE